MKSVTKIKRANLAYNIIRNNEGVPKTLEGWLTTINKELNRQNCLRNTKEMAHMLRYIRITKGIKIIRKRKLSKMEDCKMCSIIYTIRTKPEKCQT